MKTLLIQTKKLVMITLFMSVSSLFAQKTAPDYQYAFDGQVKWMMLHESGTLIASTGEALVGIRPNSKEVSFKFDRLKKVKEENLELVPETPYLIIKPKGMLNQGHVSVVDVVKGKIVFDTRDSDWQGGASSRYFISPEMMFVVNGMHREKGLGQYRAGVGLYDLTTGELVNIFERKASNPMAGRPDILGDNIIIPGAKNIECYDIKSGTVKWTAAVKNATSITTNEDTKEIYAFRSKGTNTVVYKVNSDTGAILWPEGNKLKGVISRVEFTPRGLAIVTNILSSGKKGLMGKVGNKLKGSGTSKIYLLDLNTGADLWDKSPKTKGIVDHFYIEEDGILFGVASGGINKIAFDGTPRWKRPLKTGAGIQIMAAVPKGLLYISETDTDLIDLNTGESVFGKTIKYKRSQTVASTYDKERDRFLLTCKDGIYEIDGNTGDYNLMTKEFNFQEKEAPSEIDVRENGILLTSSQNLQMLNFNGGDNWDVYHRSPGKSAFGVIMMATVVVASTTMSAAHSARASSMQSANNNARNHASLPPYSSSQIASDNSAAASYGAVRDAAFTEMMKRFTATKATENSAFILTKVDEGVALVKVDKDSGKTLNEIVIKDKKPMYEVDDIEGILYFKSKGNTINAYNLNN